MPGFVSEEKKYQYLQCSDLYVLSSVHEGFGIVLQEAMQVGLPIVATNFGGQTDIIEHGVNGILIDNNSIDELCQAIENMIGDNNLMYKCSINNMEKVKKYSSDNIAESYLECFKSELDKSE